MRRRSHNKMAHRVGVTEDHFRWLLHNNQKHEAEVIISTRIAKISSNRLSTINVLKKLKEDYQCFGPTLARQKLLERDGIKVSKETVLSIKNPRWIA